MSATSDRDEDCDSDDDEKLTDNDKFTDDDEKLTDDDKYTVDEKTNPTCFQSSPGQKLPKFLRLELGTSEGGGEDCILAARVSR